MDAEPKVTVGVFVELNAEVGVPENPATTAVLNVPLTIKLLPVAPVDTKNVLPFNVEPASTVRLLPVIPFIVKLDARVVVVLLET